jgi:hypothetical protein
VHGGHGERKPAGGRSTRVYADGGGAANGMGTVGTDGIGGKTTLGTTDGTTTGIGGRVSLGSTDGTAGIGGNGTATLGAAGMGGSVIWGTVTVGTAAWVAAPPVALAAPLARWAQRGGQGRHQQQREL